MSANNKKTNSEDHGNVPLAEYVKSRLDGQDNLLKEILDGVKSVKRQAIKTNGRVTELESKEKVREALVDQARTAVSNRRWWIDLSVGCACVLAGGLINHLVGAL